MGASASAPPDMAGKLFALLEAADVLSGEPPADRNATHDGHDGRAVHDGDDDLTAADDEPEHGTYLRTMKSLTLNPSLLQTKISCSTGNSGAAVVDEPEHV